MIAISLTSAQVGEIFDQCTNELELINASDELLVRELAARLGLKRVTHPHPNEDEYYDDNESLIVFGALGNDRVEFYLGSCGDIQQIGVS